MIYIIKSRKLYIDGLCVVIPVNLIYAPWLTEVLGNVVFGGGWVLLNGWIMICGALWGTHEYDFNPQNSTVTALKRKNKTEGKPGLVKWIKEGKEFRITGRAIWPIRGWLDIPNRVKNICGVPIEFRQFEPNKF